MSANALLSSQMTFLVLAVQSLPSGTVLAKEWRQQWEEEDVNEFRDKWKGASFSKALIGSQGQVVATGNK